MKILQVRYSHLLNLNISGFIQDLDTRSNSLRNTIPHKTKYDEETKDYKENSRNSFKIYK